MYFHATIGSNIDPERNVEEAIQRLVDRFGSMTVFPRVYTDAENVEGDALFINTAVVFQSQEDEPAVKLTLNTIEGLLGRNRNDPNRSILPRTCDIDILAVEDNINCSVFETASENYVRAIFSSQRHAALASERYPELRNGATTINLDR